MSNVKPIEDLFQELIDLPRGEDRRDFLDRVCGDDVGLREQLEGLVRAHEQAGSFLQDEADETRDLDSGSVEGRTIGPYKLRELIGEGGMGSVYVAEQEKPLRRKVALKVIKPGMDSKAILGRFEAERNALALMNHPNIAKVLDAGQTEQGRPYFVMELVNGIPITDYCDQQKLTIRERLELFIDVCQAIQHAHQKGIIHRDIKPSNVLVTELDGKPITKVIDFGVAKALNQTLTEHSVYTAFQTVIGTPLYMSPEQASFSAVDVDTRSDVYSLGVLLYELLTGTTPLSRDDLRDAAQDEVLRLIRETEPPRPSNRISRLGDTATRVSQLRRTQPETLGRTVKGDVDWIVLKALSKERERRYDSPNRLAEDISRHLNSEPIPRPTSYWYQVRRFYHRNRMLARGIAAAFIALSIGLGIAFLQNLELIRAIEGETAVATLFREQTFENTLLKLLSGDPNATELINEAIDAGLSKDRIDLLRAQAAIYSGRPESAIASLESILDKDPENVPATALLALSCYYSGDLWRGVSMRDRASSMKPREPIDRVYLASCAFGVDPNGLDHINEYLRHQKTPLGFAVRANLSAWQVHYGDDRNRLTQAFEDIRSSRPYLGSTAYVLQTELHVNMQAIKSLGSDKEERRKYIRQAKAAEAELANRFPDYFWGNFQRGSFWYALGEYEKVEQAWASEANDWNRANLALVLDRAGKTERARELALGIKSPIWQLVCFPVLADTKLGVERLELAYGHVLSLGESNQAYREPFVLLLPWFWGDDRQQIQTQAQKLLANWEPNDDKNSWDEWNRSITRFLAGELTPQELHEKASGIGPRELGIHFYLGMEALTRNDEQTAILEFQRAFNPEWQETFLSSMWAALVLEELNSKHD